MENQQNHLIRTFGRVKGKKLSARQKNLIETLLPAIHPSKNKSDAPIRVLEIGFGAGEHIVHLAQNPNFNIVGAEPFVNGVASLLSKIDGVNYLDRISIWNADVREYIAANTGVKFDLIYILHPDPWPKARHEKHRLLQSEFLDLLDTILAKDGVIILGTDHTDYFLWALSKISTSNFIPLNKDYNFIPTDGLTTRYKDKNKFGSAAPYYAVLTRREDNPSPERLASFDLVLE